MINPELKPKVTELLDKMVLRSKHNIGIWDGSFPDYYDRRQKKWYMNGYWTEAFWPGIMWWLYLYSRDPFLRDTAEYMSKRIAAEKIDLKDHDLGFLFNCSCVLGYTLTGSSEFKEVAIKAADRLSRRFNPRGNFIPAHGDVEHGDRRGYTIIDTIMNLRLLFWAHRMTGEQCFYDVGLKTAETILHANVRNDGSTYQVIWFDPDSGKIEGPGVHQGYNADSCWSRGQAWGIYGFSWLYRQTGDERFKEAAVRLANFFLRHLPEDKIAYYDLLDPRIPNVERDSSASSIAVAGLLILASSGKGLERYKWFVQAEELLTALVKNSSDHLDSTVEGGLLPHGCYFLSKDRGVDSELGFGDYYLVEALLRYYMFGILD